MTKKKRVSAKKAATPEATPKAAPSPPPAAPPSAPVERRTWRALRRRPRRAALTALGIGAVFVGVLVVFGGGFLGRASIESRPLEVAPGGKSGFTAMSSDATGITFVNDFAKRTSFSATFADNGSGVALGDYDGDGLCDIYFTALAGDNVLYRNLGDWHFEDVTAKAGVACPGDLATGTAFADADGDGDLDLFVSKLPGLRYFRNNGDGTFADATAAAGLVNSYGNMSLALADVEGDGDLDLYVASYRTDSLRDGGNLNLKMVGGKLTVPPELRDRVAVVNGKLQELGEPDVLYLNDGSGQFSPVSWTSGAFLDEEGERMTGPPLAWGLGASMRDMDGDGDPDIYVCNDFASPDTILTNLGDGRFQAVSSTAIRSTSATSMGVDFADVDRDGDLDLFVGDMRSVDHAHRARQMPSVLPTPSKIGALADRQQVGHNTLLLNRGDATYAEIGNLAGVASTGWSWATLFFDVDLDGYDDLFVANGFIRDVQDADAAAVIEAKGMAEGREVGFAERQSYLPRLDQPNVAFRNMGGLRFEDRAKEWGLDATGITNGAATGDLDGDGDLDLVVSNFQKPAGIYRNESAAPRVAVRLAGDGANTRAIGAKVRLVGGPVEQSREIGCGGEYLSCSEPIAVFAAGEARDGLRLEVTWRDGAQSVVDDVRPNSIYTIAEPRWGRSASAPEAPDPIFEDATAKLAHSHRENEFDDFARQPLLPNRLGQLGPGVAWADVDGDGDDDLLVATGKDGRTALLVNDGAGGFAPSSGAAPSGRDQTAVVVWSDAGGASVLAGSSSYEDGATEPESVARFTASGGALAQTAGLAGQPSSTGPLALADVDGDGDLDLFAGGRLVPGRYPEPASSTLYRSENGQFTPDAANAAVFSSVGMASGATFSDLDGDGDADLVLALEWGPIAVFTNDGGTFTNATERMGLAGVTGRWNGVATGDLDGDGRADIVATNWGLNNPYAVSPEHPGVLLYGDADGNGTLDVFEAYDENGRLVPALALPQLATGVPSLVSRFPTLAAFGDADVYAVFGAGASSAGRATAATLAHTIFLNRGDRFEAASLPIEAQFAPAFGVAVADFDGDGNEDVFVAQNFFAVRPDAYRWDAGRGLLMRGDGRGGLAPVAGQASGIADYGEARGDGVADYDGDARADLAVAQNGAATRLFRNRLARPGLRVRLEGGHGNPNGVGAAVRLVWGDRQGPVREVQAGGGYWSQNSSTVVLGAPERPTAVWVRWPGGETTTTPVPSGATEVVVKRNSRG
jgi:hypothetical protein